MYKYIAMSKNIRYSIILTVVSILFFGAQSAHAEEVQQAITISPVVQDITLSPGKESSYTIIISNNADLPLGIHTDITGFDENNSEITTFSTKDSPMIGWTAISEQDIILKPHSTHPLIVIINPPSSLKKGGYYTTLFFTPFISKPRQAKGPIILSRIGALVLGTYGEMDYRELSKKVMLSSFSIDSFFRHTSTSTIHMELINTYFAHLTAKPFLSITPLFGQTTKVLLDEKHILPSRGKTWNNTILLPPNPWLFYSATMAVSVGQGNYIYGHTFFIVIPWVKELLTALVLILFIIIATVHKRVRKSIQIILQGK